MGLIDSLRHAWNAFIGLDPPTNNYQYNTYMDYGQSFSYRPDKIYLKHNNEKSIISAIYNRIALDCSSTLIKHVMVDPTTKRYVKDVDDGLNNCITIEANKDQTAKAFFKDVIISLFDEGVVAVVPVDTTDNILQTNSYDIVTMRVAKILQWYPDYITVEVYNDNTGNKVNITLPKAQVAIIENPLSLIMNEPNSTLKRLIHKLSLLDVIDEQSGSGKLDLIIQLPYVIKTELRKKEAETRRSELEKQLQDTKYGIAYTDGTEKITQLNRPVENNLMKQVEYLTSMLYSQLGITDSILNGTADEKTMLNYINRTVSVILDAIVDEFKRKFLTKTARTNGHDIIYVSNPFRFVTINDLANSADKFTRNEILSSNEIRQIMGYKPSTDPNADSLRNKNILKENTADGSIKKNEENKTDVEPEASKKED